MSRCPIIFEIPARKGWIGPFLEHVVVDVVDVVDVVFGVVVRVARQRGEELPRRPHLGADLHGADGPRRRLQGCQPGRQLRLPAVGRQLHPPHRSRTLFFSLCCCGRRCCGSSTHSISFTKKKAKKTKDERLGCTRRCTPFYTNVFHEARECKTMGQYGGSFGGPMTNMAPKKTWRTRGTTWHNEKKWRTPCLVHDIGRWIFSIISLFWFTRPLGTRGHRLTVEGHFVCGTSPISIR